MIATLKKEKKFYEKISNYSVTGGRGGWEQHPDDVRDSCGRTNTHKSRLHCMLCTFLAIKKVESIIVGFHIIVRISVP